MTPTTRSGSWRQRMFLTWDIRGAEPANEDETVAIEADGTTWLWVRVPAERERGDVVGSFRTRAGDDRRAEARRLLDLIAAPPEAAPKPGHRGTVTVAGGGTARTLPLRDGSGLAADAIHLARELARAAFAEPLAAVRFSARLRPSLDLTALEGVDPDLLPDVLKPGPAGPTALIGLVVDGLGSEATTLALDTARLQAHWMAGDRAVGWNELPRPDVGLSLRRAGDGIRAPATIEPDETGALTVRAELPDEPADAVIVRVAGRIALIGPWPSKGTPETSYDARTRPAPMGSAG